MTLGLCFTYFEELSLHQTKISSIYDSEKEKTTAFNRE